MDYKSSGVDIEAGYKAVELMKEHVKKTMRPEVLGGLGGFSGAFSMEAFKRMERPTLVSGTDGVGTKLKLAFVMNRHDTVGIDCVAMCVNDIACAGGEHCFSSITSPAERIRRRKSRRSSRAYPRDAFRRGRR